MSEPTNGGTAARVPSTKYSGAAPEIAAPGGEFAGATPGPWRIGETDDGQIVGPRLGCSSPIVCVMPTWWTGRKPGEHVSQDLQRANARLIAAAPALLAQRDAARNDAATKQRACDALKEALDAEVNAGIRLRAQLARARRALQEIASCAERPEQVDGSLLGHIATVARAALGADKAGGL